MKQLTLLIALFVGACAAALSVLMIHDEERFGPAIVLLFPGFILAMAVSGNVHAFSISAVAMGNFGFYFAITCVVQIVRKRWASPR
jgi:hypothetical protein